MLLKLELDYINFKCIVIIIKFHFFAMYIFKKHNNIYIKGYKY